MTRPRRPLDHLAPGRTGLTMVEAAAQIQRGMAQFREGVIKAARLLGQLNRHTQARALLARRKVLGGMGTDARRWPDQWQSTICAGLLCSITPCPSDEHDLRCTHSCHEVGR